jgi:hypothetical protein
MRIFCNADVKLESNSTAEQVLFTIAENASGVRGENLSHLSQDSEIILPVVVHHRMDTDERVLICLHSPSTISTALNGFPGSLGA